MDEDIQYKGYTIKKFPSGLWLISHKPIVIPDPRWVLRLDDAKNAIDEVLAR